MELRVQCRIKYYYNEKVSYNLARDYKINANGFFGMLE